MAATRRGIWAILGLKEPFDPACTLVTSPVFSPLVLAVMRLTLAVYGTTFIVVRLIYDQIHFHTDAQFFSYFTDLTYIGILSYFWASGVQTLCFALSHSTHYPLQRWPRILQFFHLLLHSTITTFPVLVTVVFWSLLSSPDTLATRYSAWSNISEHALNTVFAAFEIALTHAAPGTVANSTGVAYPWIHLPFLVIILACYLGVAYITHATQGWYPYSFLNPQVEHAKLAIYIVGIPVAEILLFIIMRSFTALRASFLIHFGYISSDGPVRRPTSTLLDREKNAKEEEAGQVEALDEWEEVERPSGSGSGTGVAM